jgi:serine/threonine protein kinase
MSAQRDAENYSRSRSSEVSYSPPDERDAEGLIKFQHGAVLNNRYRVVKLAGQGTFGTVLEVRDTTPGVDCDRLAIKVIRSVPRYMEAAKLEVEILHKIKNAEQAEQKRQSEQKQAIRQNPSLCVRLMTTFEETVDSKRHVCIGFEKLGRSLYEFIKNNNYRGFSIRNVKLFGYQLLWAVAFCHRMKLVHTDLKPENILLVSSKYTMGVCPHPEEKKKSKFCGHPTLLGPPPVKRDYRVPQSHHIRLIDFGGATFENDHHSRIINTRQYRGPEVLLGLSWSYPSDIWSVGCILPELLTGDYLFSTHEDMEHLALMEKILQRRLPKSLTDAALTKYRDGSPTPAASERKTYQTGRAYDSPCQYEHHHRSIGELKSRSRSSDKNRNRSGSLPTPDALLHTTDGCLRWPEKASNTRSLRRFQRAETLQAQFSKYAHFEDLLRKMLQFDPKLRITAEAALRHPFFDEIRELMQSELGTLPIVSGRPGRAIKQSTIDSFARLSSPPLPKARRSTRLQEAAAKYAATKATRNAGAEVRSPRLQPALKKRRTC